MVRRSRNGGNTGFAVVREVNCVGISHTAAAKSLDKRLPEHAALFKKSFEQGLVDPGKLLALPAGKPAKDAEGETVETPTFIFNLPVRVHWRAPIKTSYLRRCIESVLTYAVQHQVYHLEILPFESTEDDPLSWPDIKLEFLTSLARIPDITYAFPNPPGTPERPKITAFTDGGAEGNPGPGGYGVVLRFGSALKELSAGFRKTTNNRMELLGAIAALEALKGPSTVLLHSDSRYVVDPLATGAIFRWRAKNWKNGKVKNIDLWERMLSAYLPHDVQMIWVKGHAGVPDNERADQLASLAFAKPDLPKDEGYETPKAPKGGEKKTSKDKPARGPKPKKVGDPCRKCGKPLVHRETKKSNPKSKYYFTWYLWCEPCRAIFHVKEAKVWRNKPN